MATIMTAHIVASQPSSSTLQPAGAAIGMDMSVCPRGIARRTTYTHASAARPSRPMATTTRSRRSGPGEAASESTVA